MRFQRFKKQVRRFPKKRFIPRKVYGTTECPRLVVFRSLKHIYGQLVDDTTKKTLITVSSASKELRAQLKNLTDKSEKGKIVGRTLAAKAKAMNIKRVVFDRNGFVVHGRVKALVDGAREGGLWFERYVPKVNSSKS
ncbi:MAG: 50S ribosomal protein L18 [candidate division KSB1 bacterium]|nr:50S ribosomal protein L18 [candidate division KSB1 bacterium]MDZ7300986.1 50S ribosomal protein L18 [candidate division KSB1 bacterium]MDZ7310336.1 50S ribosomal protein L18 [candidate division KSB1 bacterium]